MPESNGENAGEAEEVFLNEEGQPEQPEAAPPEEDSAQVRYMRLMADFENFRKRTAKEIRQENQKGRRQAAENILPVYDSITMGLLKMPADSPARSGMEAVGRQFLDALRRIGIEKLETVGQPFDPELHEAIGHMPNANHAEGIVCEESRAGFQDSVGLLRPAQVLVSSGA